MATIGRWNDDDDVAAKHHLSSADDDEKLIINSAVALDIVDLLQHPERNISNLPAAWRGENNSPSSSPKIKHSSAGITSPLAKRLKQKAVGAKMRVHTNREGGLDALIRRTEKSPLSSPTIDKKGAATSSAAGGSPTTNRSVHSLRHSTHDDDLAAYIASKEERRLEKEAVRQLNSDAIVPAHVKQMINKQVRSRGVYRQRRQYGYSEPVSLPIHRRADPLSRPEGEHHPRHGAAATRARSSSPPSARSGVGATATTAASQQQQQPQPRSRSSNVHGGGGGGGAATMTRIRQRPVWDASTYSALPPISSHQNPPSRRRHPHSAHVGDAASASKGKVQQQNRSASTSRTSRLPPPSSTINTSSVQIQSPPSQPRHHRYNNAFDDDGDNGDLTSGGGVSNSTTFLTQQQHHHTATTNRSALMATTTTQYLSEMKARDSMALTVALPPEAAKLVAESVEATQHLRDKVKAGKDELEQLTISAESLRKDIAAGAPIARKHTQLQQAKTRLEAEKRQREGRCHDLERMIMNLMKRLEKQEQQQREIHADTAAKHPDVFAAATGGGDGGGAGDSFAAHQQQQADDKQSSSLSGFEAFSGGANLSLLTAQDVSDLHKRIDELKARREHLARTRDRKIAAATIELKQLHQLQSMQQRRRSASNTSATTTTSRRRASTTGRDAKRGGGAGGGGRGGAFASSSSSSSVNNKYQQLPPITSETLNDMNSVEKRVIAEQSAALRKQLMAGLEKEVRDLKADHEKAMSHRQRTVEGHIKSVVKSQEELHKRVSELSQVGEAQATSSADSKLAQAALDTQVQEKLNQLRQVSEQRRSNEEAVKKVVNQTATANAQLAKLRQELLVAENVPVQKHLDEDHKRNALRNEKTTLISNLKTEEQRISKHIQAMTGQLQQTASELQAMEAAPAARDPQVILFQNNASAAELRLADCGKVSEAAQMRLAIAKQRLQTAKHNQLANEAQDVEIAGLTKALEAKKVKLREENGRNMELLEKLDRAERLLAMSGGIASGKK